MHSTASSETAGAAMVMTGMGTGGVGIPTTTPTTAMGMEAVGTTMTPITGAPLMIGTGTAGGLFTVIHMDMAGVPPIAEAHILVRTTAAAAPMLTPTHRVLAHFCPPCSARSCLAIKQGLSPLFTARITGTQRGPWNGYPRGLF